MSHHVESMAFAHEVPWHGLGVPVGPNATPEQIGEAAGLTWRVVKRPLYFDSQDPQEGVGPSADHLAHKHMALVRESDNRFFDVVGANWHPVQNTDVLKFFKAFCDEGGATMETAGALRGGEIVWALANLGNGFVLPGGDAVKGYLLLATRHKSGYATIGRITGIRVVCANTFAMAGGFEAASQLRVPHNVAFKPEEAAAAIGIARQGISELERAAKVLQGINLSRDDAIRLLQPIYQPDLEADGLTVKQLIDNYDENANRTVKGIMEAALNSPGAVPGTAWGLFNGVTYYANHKAKGSADSRMSSIAFGSNGSKANKTFRKLLTLAD